MFKKRILLPLTVLLLFFCISLPVASATMAYNDLEVGDTGYGRTVFSGIEIEEFEFEIVDLMRNYEPGRNFILVKLEGEKIDETNGVASGMSGSPLYIDDKIIGAIAYGWFQGENRYVLATPIEEMLEIIESGEKYEFGDLEELPELRSPIMISGISGRSLDRLETALNDYISADFKVIPGGDETDLDSVNQYYPELQPGSSVAVQMARGDINLASIGTLTYRDDSNILAFGHPFTNRGEVNFFLSQARISQIIPGKEPFKLGSPVGRPLGMIRQDRGAGIGGELDVFPEVVPYSVDINDHKRGKETNIAVQIINDEDLLTSLVPTIALQSIDTGLDRIGSGLAKTKIEIIGNNLPGLTIERENIFYSRDDIASRSLSELQELLRIINQNSFKEVNLIDINFTVDVEDTVEVALIEKLEIQNEDKIYPGDDLDIKVALRPYRQESFEFEFTLSLPEDMEPGPTSMSVMSGDGYSYYNYGNNDFDNYQEELNTSAVGFASFEEQLEEFLDRPKNNDLVLEVYPGFPAAPAPEEEAEVEPALEESETEDEDNGRPGPDSGEAPKEVPVEQIQEDPLREVVETDYVLEGNLYLDFMIENPDQDSNEENPDYEELESNKRSNRSESTEVDSFNPGRN
ncbi:MAG: SpoIVB peptidase S55 domain-containing protein [Halarsenatibacteraceae bacterium]